LGIKGKELIFGSLFWNKLSDFILYGWLVYFGFWSRRFFHYQINIKLILFQTSYNQQTIFSSNFLTEIHRTFIKIEATRNRSNKPLLIFSSKLLSDNFPYRCFIITKLFAFPCSFSLLSTYFLKALKIKFEPDSLSFTLKKLSFSINLLYD
jgi:hypothetical protein